MHLRRVNRATSQRGSVAIGLTIVLVVGLLSVGLVARAAGNLTNVRRTQDFSAALAAADGGLADFLFQLDQQPTTTTITGSSTLGEGTFSYTASRVVRNLWTVRVTGTVNGVGHAIEATVARPAKYLYALFTQQSLDLNGNGAANISSYDSTTGFTDTGNAIIGSNREISITGGGGGDAQHYYTPDGSCSNCDNPVQQEGPKALEEPQEPTSGQSCPTGGSFPSTIDGLSGNPFICYEDISFPSGNVTIINPPAIIYVAPNYSVTITGSNINSTGAGKDFRILKAGTGALTLGSGANVGHMVGVLYAPSTDLVVPGGQMFIDGSLTLNRLTINGDPNFVMGYDDSILDITSGEWSVHDWREVPSGTL
jgi:hypothetical protein